MSVWYTQGYSMTLSSMYCTIGKTIYGVEVFWSDSFTSKKNVIEKRTGKNQVFADNLFRLQFFRSGVFAEKFLSRTSCQEPSHRL